MTGHLLQLAQARTARDAARGVFEARLDQIRRDLEVRGVGGRMADRLGEDAKTVLDEVLDVAADSKGIIAGTIAVIALWLMRHPIVAWISGLIEDHTGNSEEDHDD